MSYIKFENISKRFGSIIAIQDINLEINKGEYIAVLGPSGSGKTTIVKTLSGIFTPTSGRIFARNEELTDKGIETRKISYVFQNVALFPHLDVYKNVTYGPWVQGEEASSIQEKGSAILELVDLLELKGFFPKELSGGISQKVGLARALATGYDILILDEPLSALDARVSINLRYQLRDLVKKLGLTAIHITHDQTEAMSVADRICIIKKGKIVECGTPRELYYFPKKLFTAFFVGENNLLEGFILDMDRERVHVFLRRGWVIKGHPQDEIVKGDPIVLTIRPELLELLDEEDDNTIPCKIIEKRFNGPSIRYKVKLETGDTVTVDSTRDIEFTSDQWWDI
ncbi:MAG: ABC transporter ATP-binding protein [Candidatus Hodarchaeales archaeon]